MTDKLFQPVLSGSGLRRPPMYYYYFSFISLISTDTNNYCLQLTFHIFTIIYRVVRRTYYYDYDYDYSLFLPSTTSPPSRFILAHPFSVLDVLDSRKCPTDASWKELDSEQGVTSINRALKSTLTSYDGALGVVPYAATIDVHILPDFTTHFLLELHREEIVLKMRKNLCQPIHSVRSTYLGTLLFLRACHRPLRPSLQCLV